MSPMIGPRTSTAERPHRVLLQNPGPAVPDGDGGYTQSWTDLVPPALSGRIAPPTARDLEMLGAGTVTSAITHVISGPFHHDVTTKTRLLFNGRIFHVVSVANVEERRAEMVLLATELVP
jgi:SPP1 family predicted phage head-tail adaptor